MKDDEFGVEVAADDLHVGVCADEDHVLLRVVVTEGAHLARMTVADARDLAAAILRVADEAARAGTS